MNFNAWQLLFVWAATFFNNGNPNPNFNWNTFWIPLFAWIVKLFN